MNFFEQSKSLALKHRRRVILSSRFQNGVSFFIKRPWLLPLPLLVVAVAAYTCFHPDIIPMPSSSTTALFVIELWHVAIALLVVTLAVFLLGGMLIKAGTPRHAKSIDAALFHVGLVDRYGIGPALISSEKSKQSSCVNILSIYSKGVGREQWIAKQGEIEDILNIHYLEPPAYGKNRHFIVLTVSPGVTTDRDAPLYDEEL
jgi:hypothetical protein